MSLKNRYGSNPSKENDGVLIPFGYNEDGTEIGFKLRRLWKYNKKYGKAFEEKMRAYHNIDITLLPEGTASTILEESFIEGILVDWQNVLLSDVTGKDSDKGFAPFSVENAKLLFANNKGIYDDLYDAAQSIANFKDVELKAKAKN